MDEDEINNLVQGCKRLKYKFHGVFTADNFPLHLSRNSFIIVNVSTSQSIGTHWILICRRNGDYIFAGPLGQNLFSYKRRQCTIDLFPLLVIYTLYMNC